MADIFEISGRIHSTSQEEVVTTSSEILDENKNKKQSEVNAEVETALADVYTKSETYSKSQLDNLITTPNVQYVTVATYSALPATGEADTIYRVASWDGSAVDAGKYSEYAWNGSAYQLLAVRSGSLDGVYDISANNLTEGQPTQYADLAAALGTNGANVPFGVRAGGMQVRFINSSTGMYKQCRLMTASWSTTVADWQDVDESPTTGSQNLVTSGGVYSDTHIIEKVTLQNQGTQYKNVYVGNDTSIGQVGEIVDSSSSSAFGAEIDLPPNSKFVKFYSYVWNGDYGWAFIDNNGNVISYHKNDVSLDWATLQVPSGAVKVRLALRSVSGVDSKNVEITKVFNIKDIKTALSNEITRAIAAEQNLDNDKLDKSVVKQSLGSSETDVLSQKIVTDNIQDLNLTIGDFESTEYTKTLSNQGTQYKNVYVGADSSIGSIGEIINTSSQSAHAAEIQIPDNAVKITFYARKWTGDYGYAFLNEDNEVIGYAAYKDLISELIESITINVPSGTKYAHISLGGNSTQRDIVITLKKSIVSEIDGIKSNIEGIQEEIEDMGYKFPPYSVIGAPMPYISTLETTGLSLFTDVSTLYSAWDELASAHSSFLKKETDIGMDASNTYALRHYTLRFQYPNVNTERDLSGTNQWDDEVFKIRRLLLVMGVHGSERPSVLGGYLAIKEILESTDDWAKFIKTNFIIDIVPLGNPWGFENNSRDNFNGVNLNRDYNSQNPQSETSAMKLLISDLNSKGLVGVVDCHNCNYDDGGYLVAKTTYSHFVMYARLAQQIQSLMFEPLNTVFGTTSNNHFHLWEADGNDGQLHEYVDSLGLLGCTFEIANNAGISGSILTKSIAINLMATFGSYVGK